MAGTLIQPRALRMSATGTEEISRGANSRHRLLDIVSSEIFGRKTDAVR